ncbi:MAG: AAA family ATPase [Thioploca sp.]|nr:AAA family ATPase [Thioploca sp.]
MYYEHFGLNYPPFKITPDTQLFYPGGDRGLVLEALVYAIETGEGIIKVVGEVGSGKTMLCRMLAEKLSNRIEIVYLANPRLAPDMILQAIALEMRLSVTPQCNRLQVMHALQTRLLEKHADNQQVVIFIEEAQEMPLETLEEIRLLSNLETTRNKLLQIVLFGQPELDSNLAVTHIRQLKERITHRFYLRALSREDIKNYLHFRMQAVGYRGPPVFSPTAVRILTQVSKGLMRRINILADKALLAAFAENEYQVKTKHIRLAARDSSFKLPLLSNRWVGLGLLALSTSFILIVGSWFYQPLLEKITINETILPLVSQPELAMRADSLLQQRIQATQQWLNSVDQQHYSIQVMQTPVENTPGLTQWLHKPEIQPLLPNLYLYQVDRNGQLIWEILYADFTDINSASAAMTTLPDILRNNKPFLRKVASLKWEGVTAKVK